MRFLNKFFNWFNKKSASVILLIVMTYILGAQGDRHYKYTSHEKHKHEIYANINSDGGGYYAYLPQYLIYKTKHFEFAHFIQKKYPKEKFFQGISPKNNTEFQDKYFIGTAICISPFFLVCHQLTNSFSGDADGYSLSYQASMFVAALAFWLLGVLSLLSLLQKFQISRSAILIGIIGLTFGTNLNYYIVYDPSFSHVYTFGMVAFFLLKIKLYAENQNKKDLVWLFFLLGLITIIRPTNFLIVLFIPFFFKSFNELWERIKIIFSKQKIALLIGSLIFGFLIFLQFWNIHSQHGVWQFNAYSAEGFDFLSNPKIPEVLFGFRKGLFIYSPFLLLIFPALWFLYRSNRFAFIWFMIFTSIYIYVLSSWWCWYYGGSMGMRAMIDIFPVLIIPIIFIFQKLNRFFKGIIIVFVFFMIQYNLILNFQLLRSILHYSEMNKVRFEQIFLQKGARFEWVFHNTQPYFEKEKFEKTASFNFNPTKKVWLVDSKNTYIKEFYGTLPSLILHTNSKIKDSRIAIKLNYFQKINSEKSIPKALMFGYRNEQRELLCVDYIGTRVASLNKFYPIDSRLTSTFKYADFDSLQVMIENNDGIVKNPVCNIFSFKKRKLIDF
jgi:hypothetical protein